MNRHGPIPDYEDHEIDQYGNPIDGSRLIYCCFPDCGCDGARLCMAEKGASDNALGGNVESMWSSNSREARTARGALIAYTYLKDKNHD